MKKTNIILFCLTPLYMWLSLITAFVHEYAHSITAWALGFMQNPFKIIYGGWSWPNIIFLANIDENVNYALIEQLGHRKLISLIAFAGSGFGTLPIYLITLYLLRKTFNRYLYCFIFWVNLCNLRELWAYVPLRALSSHADMANINYSLDISKWWIFILFTPLVAWGVVNFFRHTIKTAYVKLGFDTAADQAALLMLTIIYFFGLTGLQILTADYNWITRALTWSSFLLIPVILYCCWPRKIYAV